MPTQIFTNVETAPSGLARLRVPLDYRSAKLKPSGAELTSTYVTDTKTFSESDWVYLQIALVAYQIHPATIAELALLGPIGSANMKRWTIEGPLMHRPGDPGPTSNCTMLVELAHSMTADPGTDWRAYSSPGRFRLRSAQARLIITRPDTSMSFRVARFSLLARRISAPQRSRKVRSSDSIPAGMCRVVPRDFEVDAGASLEIEAGGYLEVMS